MAETTEQGWRRLLLDKTEIQQIVAETNAASRFVPDPTATPKKAQMMIALGIRPEDNIFSCGIIAARDEE